jgi:hypothetical protein
MTRRLLHYYLDNYSTNQDIKKIVDKTELWFIVVANPDGYDYTFTPGNRLWRKTLSDNNGDGQITGLDGVDPNRNWPNHWGYDNEGSSPDPTSETYRGTGPESEPETKAFNGLLRKVKAEFLINYHSAAMLLLYGTGWQVSTPTPDDLLSEAMLGDDATPAVPGYDPDISAELYTTNGETTEHAHNTYNTVAWTPEMSTCAAASNFDPDDEFEPEDCQSDFIFPDSEALVQHEFENNIPLAVNTAKSAQDPDDPISPVGRTAPNFKVDSFEVSYGDPQTVAVTAKRAIKGLTLNYRINNGRTRTAHVSEWRGGERYGDEYDVWYGEFRGQVRGARAGDSVEVWFSGVQKHKGRVSSEHFTYELVKDASAPVLIIANEDYTGVNPTYPASVTAPKYAGEYAAALTANGVASETWDVDAQGVPHDLGVLSHFRGIVWEIGDNRLTQDPEDEITETPLGNLPDLAVAERQQFLTMAVRDFLNAGGKLVHTGETAGYYGLLGSAVGGLYYGLDGAHTEDCVISSFPGFFEDCLFLADDFSQYYLGALDRTTFAGPESFAGAGDLDGATGTFGGPAVADNPLDEAGVFTVTSDVLPPAQFPQFASESAGEYLGAGGVSPFEPVEGSFYVGALHADDSYMRLARTVDLTGVPAAQAPKLQFQLSFNTEPGYDSVIVEAHNPGQDNWTTLPDENGGTTQQAPPECADGSFLFDSHPFLTHYLSGTPCGPSGTTGSWNAFTGNSGGWRQVSVDLSAYAGQQVEVSISYVTDPGSGGVGAFVDDTRLVAGGATVEAEGFETGLGAWSIPGPPPPSINANDWVRSGTLVDLSAAVTTSDTVLLGFGVEQFATPADRAAVLGRALAHLGLT